MLILSVCALVACGDSPMPSNTETEPDTKLEWRTHETSSVANRIKGDITYVELLTFETASAYSRDYFNENSLILYQEYVQIGEEYSVPVVDVRTDGEQIILVKKVSDSNEDPSNNTAVVSASRIDSTFIEVHNFIPKSTEVKLIYEYDDPPRFIGGEQRGTIEITQSESAALPQYRYLDYESTDKLIKEYWDSQEYEAFPRSFFNIHDLIMVQAITSTDDEAPPTISRVETDGSAIIITVTRYAAVSDAPTSQNTKYWCLLVSTRCFRPELTEVKVQYYTHEEHRNN